MCWPIWRREKSQPLSQLSACLIGCESVRLLSLLLLLVEATKKRQWASDQLRANWYVLLLLLLLLVYFACQANPISSSSSIARTNLRLTFVRFHMSFCWSKRTNYVCLSVCLSFHLSQRFAHRALCASLTSRSERDRNHTHAHTVSARTHTTQTPAVISRAQQQQQLSLNW